jgi:hypothetical protein
MPLILKNDIIYIYGKAYIGDISTYIYVKYYSLEEIKIFDDIKLLKEKLKKSKKLKSIAKIKKQINILKKKRELCRIQNLENFKKS